MRLTREWINKYQKVRLFEDMILISVGPWSDQYDHGLFKKRPWSRSFFPYDHGQKKTMVFDRGQK